MARSCWSTAWPAVSWPRVDAESPGGSEVAVQGAGGAFLVAQDQGSVRTISTAKLQLGTAQPVASLLDPDAEVRRRIQRPDRGQQQGRHRKRRAVDDVARPSERSNVGQRLGRSRRQHVADHWDRSHARQRRRVDDHRANAQRLEPNAQRSAHMASPTTTTTGIVRWIGGNDIDLRPSLPNPSDAVLQEPGDDALCVWLGVDDTLNVCRTDQDRTDLDDPGYAPVGWLRRQVGGGRRCRSRCRKPQ